MRFMVRCDRSSTASRSHRSEICTKPGVVVLTAAANPPLRHAIEGTANFSEWFEAALRSKTVLTLAAAQVFGSGIEVADSNVQRLKGFYQKELEAIKQAEIESGKDKPPT